MEGHIAHVQKVVSEVLLDHITLVAAANHECKDAMGLVDVEDMPRDRLAADLHNQQWA